MATKTKAPIVRYNKENTLDRTKGNYSIRFSNRGKISFSTKMAELMEDAPCVGFAYAEDQGWFVCFSNDPLDWEIKTRTNNNGYNEYYIVNLALAETITSSLVAIVIQSLGINVQPIFNEEIGGYALLESTVKITYPKK